MISARPYHVIVVGAGLAGLGVAYELSKHAKFKVTLLEQRNRVGGRVHALPVADQMVDYGGFVIYPWYTQFHRILTELSLHELLESIPLQDIYYYLEGKYYAQDEIPFSKKDTAMLSLKMAKPVFQSRNVAEPNLTAFDGMTGAEYFRSALGRVEHAGLYETYTDTVNQGYCYPSVDRFKMAFMAPFIFKSRFQGDVSSSFYIPSGNHQVPQALAAAITKTGGEIRLNTKVTRCEGNMVHTNHGDVIGDAVVFAQNVEAELYQSVLPDVDTQFEYTQYYTVTIQCSKGPTIHGDTNWGAVFYQPNTAPLQIVSTVHLPILYGQTVDGYINLNIVQRQATQQPLTAQQLLEKLQPELQQLFPDVTIQRLFNLVYWPKTMPISNEEFVATIRQRQGKLGHYFAGDYLGAPSMETALTTGVQAAEQLISDLT